MKKTLLFFLVLLWLGNVHAQSSSPEIVASAGASFQGNNYQINWTLGELAITTISNSNQQITQGFHQAEYSITSIAEMPADFGEIQVFPNPTVDHLQMKLQLEQNREVIIQLFDTTGKLLWTKESHGQKIEETADMSNLPNGTYYLLFKMVDRNHSPTFKILKIK